MIEFLIGLFAGLLAILIGRRIWIRATEQAHAAVRAAREDAEALAAFAEGLAALAGKNATREDLAVGVARLAVIGARATSGAFYLSSADGSLGRVGVEGRHPLQGTLNPPADSRASDFAAALGDETIPQTTGLAGEAFAQRRTAILSAKLDSSRIAQLAIPVFAEEVPIGVLTLAGPNSGRDFNERTILLAEKIVRSANPYFQQVV